MKAQALAGSLVDVADLATIELLLLKRVREVTMGEHAGTAAGAGFDFVGLRDWQAGDRLSTINWPQSALRNFSPVVVSEFAQPGTASVIAVADASASTRCGVDGRPMAAIIARALATIGLSAVFFQDAFGLIAAGDGFAELGAVWPRTGRGQVLRCLHAYEAQPPLAELRRAPSLAATLGGAVRRTSFVPVISDFLFEGYAEVLRELALLAATHDVVLVLVDAAAAYRLPSLGAGWVEVVDVESGQARLLSRGGIRNLAARVEAWQDAVAADAAALDLDVVRLGPDPRQNDLALAQFVVERRVRKI